MALWFVSLIASVTSVLSLAPQVIQTYRTKSARTLSLLMLINFLICSISWVMYGYLTSTYFICVTNGITGTLALILITLKLKYDFFEKKFI
ncbi:SemiSWEET family sugar transporter [Candidatus Neptunichlamydia sp. REUL1]|uniref:SemiSWEET family sugar transporter n=1 Tax=Candidatus Neptunichlamydia sp. REUL1 TaxID=3064277 RepID=UPI00403DB0B6